MYKINCSECVSSYIGQTSRKLSFRVDEHSKCVQKAINLEKNYDKSALAVHVYETKHSIDFNKIKILDTEKSLKKGLFSEMVKIHSTNNIINRMKDTENLKEMYKNTVDLLNNKLN